MSTLEMVDLLPAAPVIVRSALRRNPNGTLRTKNPNGDFNPTPTTLSVDPIALNAALGSLQNLLVGGTAIGFNLRGAWLTGTEAATCTFIMTTVSGDTATAKNWSVTGSTFAQTLVVGSIGSGTLELFAVDSGLNQLSLGQRPWSIANPPGGTDLVAPSIPTGGTAIANPNLVNSIIVTCDPPTDITSSTGAAPTGVQSVQVRNGAGTVVATIPAALSKLGVGTLVNLGTMSPVPTVVQSVKQFTATAAGTGIHNTPTEQCLLYGWQLAGAQTMTVKVNDFSGPTAFSTAGIILHDTNVQGGIFAAWYLQSGGALQLKTRTVTGGNGTNKATIANDASGNPINGPVWLQVSRSSDLATLLFEYSTDGRSFTVASTQAVPQQQTIWWNLLLASQTGGVTCSVVFEEVSLNNALPLTATIAAVATDIYTFEALDFQGNISTRYVGASATPTSPVASAIRHRFGHVLELDQGSGGGGQAGLLARIPQARDLGFVGVHYRRGMSNYEGATAGDYSQASAFFDPLVQKCADVGIFFSVGYDDRSFAAHTYGVPGSPAVPTPSMANCPAYFQTINNGGVGYRVAASGQTWGGALGGIANVDQAYVTTRALAQAQFFATRYDTNSAFEFYRFPETAVAGGAGISNNGYFAQLGSMCATLRSYFKNSGVFFSPNYSGVDSLMIQLFQAMAPYGIGGLGPDCLFRNFPSNCVFTGFTGGHDYRNQLPCINEMQYATLTRGFANGVTPQDVYNFAFNSATSAGGSTRPNYMMIFDIKNPATGLIGTPAWAAAIPSMPLTMTVPSSYL